MCSAFIYVCFGPIADIGRSFDQLVGDLLELHRYVEAQRLGGLEVDDKLILRRRLHRHVCGLFAFEDAVDVTNRLPPHVDPIRPIGDQAACGDEGAIEVDRGQLVQGCELNDQIAIKQRPPAVTIRPPFGDRAKAVTVRSISPASRLLSEVTSTLSDGATA